MSYAEARVRPPPPPGGQNRHLAMSRSSVLAPPPRACPPSQWERKSSLPSPTGTTPGTGNVSAYVDAITLGWWRSHECVHFGLVRTEHRPRSIIVIAQHMPDLVHRAGKHVFLANRGGRGRAHPSLSRNRDELLVVMRRAVHKPVAQCAVEQHFSRCGTRVVGIFRRRFRDGRRPATPCLALPSRR